MLGPSLSCDAGLYTGQCNGREVDARNAVTNRDCRSEWILDVRTGDVLDPIACGVCHPKRPGLIHTDQETTDFGGHVCMVRQVSQANPVPNTPSFCIFCEINILDSES